MAYAQKKQYLEQRTDINTLKQIFPKGDLKEYPKGLVICDTHREVTKFRWLVEGTMDYFVTLEHPESEILVCQISKPYSTLGASGLNPPNRYTFKVAVSSSKAQFFEVSIDDLKHQLAQEHKNELSKRINSGLYHQLRTALLKQTELLQPVRFKPLADNKEFFMTPDKNQSEVIQLMRCSPFLDQFSEAQLSSLAAIAERREYEPYEVLYVQDRFTNGLYILIHGEVSIKRIEGEIEIKQRGISNAGFIFGWSCFLGEKDICNATTTQKTAIYFISQRDLNHLFKKEIPFAKQFQHQLTWLIGNQINAAFLRYAGLLGKHNLQAVFQLIENNKSRIPLTSELHKVVHLLRNLNTKEMAYKSLSHLLSHGTSLERHIASLGLELLRDDQEELQFVKGLENIYKSVVDNNLTSTVASRKACAKANLFLINLTIILKAGKTFQIPRAISLFITT